jgi:MtN3 and saliva related transmembrane protein
MSAIDLIGFAAGTLTTISFLPQVVKVWRTQSAEDLSMGMFTLFGSGVFLWLVYGLAVGSLPVIVANAITFVLAAIIVALKLRYGATAADDGSP